MVASTLLELATEFQILYRRRVEGVDANIIYGKKVPSVRVSMSWVG